MFFRATFLAVAVSTLVHGQTITARIGDLDGFGWGNPATSSPPSPHFQALNHTNGPWRSAATTVFFNDDQYVCGSMSDSDFRNFNFDGIGFLQMGDFLPDLDRTCNQVNGDTIPRRHVHFDFSPGAASVPFTNWASDDWDWRSVAEVGQASGARTATNCTFSSSGSPGANFTDITLSTTFASSFPSLATSFPGNPRRGGEQDPADLRNQPQFTFDIRFADQPTGKKFFFNMAFADFDVNGATSLRFTATTSGTPVTADFCLNKQSFLREDGFIQGVSVELNQLFGGSWSSILRNDPSDSSKTLLTIKVDVLDTATADDESLDPYTAYDFAEISTTTTSVKIKRVPEDFSTIQAAINSVPANDPGWTIVITPKAAPNSEYMERLTFSGNRVASLLGRPSTCFSGTGASDGPVINAIGLGGAAITLSGTEQFMFISGLTIKNGSATTGAGIRGNGARVEINQCTFQNNNSTGNGGAISELNGPVLNSVFTNNGGYFGGALYNCVGPILGCEFANNVATAGGGGICNQTMPTFLIQDCVFTANTAKEGGAINNFDASPTIDRCTFNLNIATRGGGAILNLGDNFSAESYPVIINSVFWKNEAKGTESGVTSGYGGAMLNYLYAIPVVTNCTFRSNYAAVNGGGISNHEDSGWATIKNCIIFGNTTPSLTHSNLYIHPSCIYGGLPIPQYSMITSYAGSGTMLITDPAKLPRFVNHASGDLRLNSSSDCLDKGTNSGAPALDRDRFQRPLLATDVCDMGAYEFH